MSIVEITEPPGAEAPLHVHHKEDEAFCVLDGSVTFEVGGATLEAGPGDVAYGPRDVPHRYTIGPEGCRMTEAGTYVLHDEIRFLVASA